MITNSEFEVLEKHTDELGHLNHVDAVKYLELARDDWYAECGLWGGRPWGDDETLGTIVVNINVNYRLECFLGEKIIVKTIGRDMGSKSFTLEQEIVKADGDVAIDGQATSVIMDMTERKTIPVPQSIGRYLAVRR